MSKRGAEFQITKDGEGFSSDGSDGIGPGDVAQRASAAVLAGRK